MRTRNWLKSRPGFNTALGLIFAVMAGLVILGYISQVLAGKGGGPLRDIPVAKEDIQAGELIDDGRITVRRIPEKYVVPGSLRKRTDIAGKTAVRLVAKGEPFTVSAVPGSGEDGTLASRIPEDMRAYSLELGPWSGAGPELSPGDRVDVLATGGDPPRTDTILTGRLVLNVEGTGNTPVAEGSNAGGVRITLLVSPGEVELLAQAICEGEITVSLCPLADGSDNRMR